MRIGEAIIRATKHRILAADEKLAGTHPEDHRQLSSLRTYLSEQRAMLANQERDEASLYAMPITTSYKGGTYASTRRI